MKQQSNFLIALLTTGFVVGIASDSIRVRAADPEIQANVRPKYGMSLEEGRRFWSYQAGQGFTGRRR